MVKIKLPQSGGDKPPMTKQVSPVVTPVTANAPALPRRKTRKTCADSWKCIDWTLLAFIIILGGGLVFKVIAHHTLRGKIERMIMSNYGEDYEANRAHAECKVVHIAENGMRSCKTASKGMQGDQLQHGWWDWMEKDDDDDLGWEKNGYFRFPMMKCKEYEEYAKAAFEKIEKMQGRTPEQIAEDKKAMEKILAEKEKELCKPDDEEEEKEWEKKEWEKFDKDMEGHKEDEIARKREELKRKCEERKREMMERRQKEEHHRERRGFNKGNMAQHKWGSEFPCHEVIVEVNPMGKHKQWEKKENDDWERNDDDDSSSEESNSHGKGGHSSEDESHERRKAGHRGGHGRKEHPHRGHERGEHPQHKEESDMYNQMKEDLKNPPKDAKDAMTKMSMMEKQFESKIKEMKARGVHHATLYDSRFTAANHRQCSVSICKGSVEKNKKCVNNFIGEFKKMRELGESFPCYFNHNDKMQVWELPPYKEQQRHHEEDSHHVNLHKLSRGIMIAGLVVFVIWLVCVLTFSIRRCIQCKRECGRGVARDTQYVNQEPQVVTVDSPELSEKEKEALGMPPESPRDVWQPGTERFYVEQSQAPASAPPAYVTLDTAKPDFKKSLDAWAETQDKQVEKTDKEQETDA